MNMKYLLPENIYQTLKWVGLVACPALATFVGVVGPVWGMPSVDAVVTTINATGLCIGALIGVSQFTAKLDPDETNDLGRHMKE